MTYEDYIAALVDRFIANPIPGSSVCTPLFAALGCTHLTHLPARQDVLVKPDQPEPMYEKLVTQTLIELMHFQLKHPSAITSENILTLLDGLLKENRWRACLQDMDTATDFAILLAYFWNASMASGAGVDLLNSVIPRVCEVLNEWVRPANPFKPFDGGRPVTYDLASEIFGSTWCALALDGHNISIWSTALIIHEQRPPVLAKLLPSHLQPTAVALPSLDAL
jgi:hypothetical protein